MAYIGVGGDGSVAWVTKVDHVRSVNTKTEGKSHRDEGIDETARHGYFKVSIKLPKVAANSFLLQLGMPTKRVPRGKITFALPIERNNRDQIRIEWNSLGSPATRRRERVRHK